MNGARPAVASSVAGDLTLDEVREALGPERAGKYTEEQLEELRRTVNTLGTLAVDAYQRERGKDQNGDQ